MGLLEFTVLRENDGSRLPAAIEHTISRLGRIVRYRGGALFYTDNANLFSATRRSSLDGDPSQPVLDTSPFGHGKDMVFEPNLRVMKFIPSSWGHHRSLSKPI